MQPLPPLNTPSTGDALGAAAQVAQIAGPVISAVAAIFAAISASAAVRAARASSEAQQRASASLSRSHRPTISVQAGASSTSTTKYPVPLIVVNSHEGECAARDVHVFIGGCEVSSTEALRPGARHRLDTDIVRAENADVQIELPGEANVAGVPLHEAYKYFNVRCGWLEYRDDLEIGLWRQEFVVQEVVAQPRRGNRRVYYEGKTKGAPHRITELDAPRDGLRRRFTDAWKVLCGQRSFRPEGGSTFSTRDTPLCLPIRGRRDEATWRKYRR